MKVRHVLLQTPTHISRKVIVSFAAIYIYCTALNVEAAVITARSCSREDVQAAIDQATDGDTVRIPEGHCIWRSPESCSGYMGPNRCTGVYIDSAGTRRGITLAGAGSGKTIITDLTTTRFDGIAIFVNTRLGYPVRISQMSFNHDGFNESEGSLPSTIRVRGTTTELRLDHLDFNFAGDRKAYAIYIQNRVYGVIDNCKFRGDSGYVAIQVSAEEEGDVTDAGESSWQRPLSLGTSDAVYVEDSEFIFNGLSAVIDGVHGARFVVRYCTIRNSYIQNHSPGHVGRGGLSSEIYNNTFVSTNSYYWPVWLRAGTGVIFNNYVTGYRDNNFQIDNQRTCMGVGKYPRCDGSSAYDGNTPGEKGWPCLDQIGRGPGGTIGNQPSEPFYAWNNGASKLVRRTEDCPTPPYNVDHLKTLGESPMHFSNVFDFVNDMARPGYTPYPYPHRLREQLDDTVSPAAPRNLRELKEPK